MTTDLKPKRVLGVDGGGSKTIAWIANVIPSSRHRSMELETIGKGKAGPSNPRSVGFETAFLNLELAIGMAMEQSSIDRSTIDVACLSLAGAGRPEEQSRIKQWGQSQNIADRTIVIDDVAPLRFAAMHEHRLAGSVDDVSWDESITLVVGTGSVACGTNRGDKASRCGGWGYLLGDEGSGFSIGLAGLRSVCQAQDRGQELSLFQRKLLAQLGLSKPSDLVGFVYQSTLPRVTIAQLSKVVLFHADKDPEAGRIANFAIDAMVQLTETTAQRLELSHRSYALALSGGILCNHPSIVSQLLSELQKRDIAPQTFQLVREPIYGPLLIAAQ